MIKEVAKKVAHGKKNHKKCYKILSNHHIMLKNHLRNFQLLSNCVLTVCYDFNPVYLRYGG